MLEGMIIGAVVGLVVSLVMILMRRGLRKEFLRLCREQGAPAARAFLDRKIRPTTRLRLSDILNQRERMSALALLGDGESLEREIDGHSGPLTAVVQVDAIGLLGLAVRSGDPAPWVQRLEALATRMEQEGGRTMVLVKKKTRALAGLGQGLLGQAIPSATRMTLESFSGDGGMVQILVWQATSLALQRAGQDEQAEGIRKKVLALTDAFEGASRGAATPER
jgi:hypothetical protein